MSLLVESYLTQKERWPPSGRHILAQFDEDSIVVYQAYRPAIGHFAADRGYFGGEFRLNRMSWIKPNFLWMMYRSGWGKKPGQEVVLAVTLKRSAFDSILAQAVHSSLVESVYDNEAAWQKALKTSLVRLQWDPDRHPTGAKRERRAIQLGLRGKVLENYARNWVLEIEDISDFVAEQYEWVRAKNWQQLQIPQESVYPVAEREVATRLGLSQE